MNLVAGATGFLGRDICRRLRVAKKPVRGLVRATSEPEVVDALQSLGVELVEGDLRDRQSLDRACRGLSAVISTATTTRSSQPGDSIEKTDQRGQLNLVEAARDASVEKFIYISFSGGISSGISGDDPLTVAKRTVEKRLRESGMIYTVLRPSYFMESWLSPAFGFDYPNAKATIFGPGREKISWISLGDVAEFAVRSLENPAAADASIELGGPEPLSPLEVVRIFEQAAGRAFEVQKVPIEDLEAEQAAASHPLEKVFAALKLAYAGGDVIPMEETLQTFPVRLTSVGEYASRALG